MKKYIWISLLLNAMTFSHAQVSIGKSETEGASVLLDFNNIETNTSGIILPVVDALPSNYTTNNNGTFLLDRSSNKIKMYENDKWIDLSKAQGNFSTVTTNSSDEKGYGVIIGSEASLAKGVLVLESTDKAIILPRIKSPHLNVKSPYPGMICYDSTSKTIALFDGNVWNYWK